MGLIHHFAQLAQHVVILSAQVKQLHIQLGHVHHLAGPLARHPCGACRGVGCIGRRAPDPVQQFLHLVVHIHVLLSVSQPLVFFGLFH